MSDPRMTTADWIDYLSTLNLDPHIYAAMLGHITLLSTTTPDLTDEDLKQQALDMINTINHDDPNHDPNPVKSFSDRLPSKQDLHDALDSTTTFFSNLWTRTSKAYDAFTSELKDKE